jgi:hypothetical protein
MSFLSANARGMNRYGSLLTGSGLPKRKRIIMHKSVKLITALSVAGLAVAAGSAFTGTGVTTTGTAAGAQFIGGTVSQNVTGVTLNSIDYGFTNDVTKTAVNKVTLTFADADTDGKVPTVALAIPSGTAMAFNCPAIDTSHKSECNAADPLVGQVGVTGVSVTLS